MVKKKVYALYYVLKHRTESITWAKIIYQKYMYTVTNIEKIKIK